MHATHLHIAVFTQQRDEYRRVKPKAMCKDACGFLNAQK